MPSSCFLTGAAVKGHMGVPPSPDDEDTLSDAHPQMTRPPGCPLGPRLPLQGGYVAVGLTRGPTLCILRGPQPSRSTRGKAREHRGWLDPLRFRTPPGSRHRVPHGAGGPTLASGTRVLDAAAAGRRGVRSSLQFPPPFCTIVTGTVMVQGGVTPCNLTPFGSWCECSSTLDVTGGVALACGV